MGARAQALAEQVERANRELLAAVEQCSEADWQAMCAAEGWTVAATAHHVAAAYPVEMAGIRAVATGQPLPPVYTGWEWVDQQNAQHAAEYAACSKAGTVELLRRNGAAAASMVRGLSDEQLDRTAPIGLFGGARWSAQQLIEWTVIGHPREHLARIRAAVSRRA